MKKVIVLIAAAIVCLVLSPVSLGFTLAGIALAGVAQIVAVGEMRKQ